MHQFVGGLGETEVENLDDALRRDLDVGRLQIAMDDATLVSGIEGVDNLTRDREGLGRWHWTACDAIGERRPFDQFHHQRSHVAGVFQAVNDGDVRMVQRGKRSPFALEPGESFLLACDGFREDFDCHVATELRVASPIDLAHPALADEGGDLVRAEPSARGQGHGGAAEIIPHVLRFPPKTP